MFSPENCAPKKVTKTHSTDKNSPKIIEKSTSTVNRTEMSLGPITLKPCEEIVWDLDEPIKTPISSRPSTSGLSKSKSERNSPLLKKQPLQKVDSLSSQKSKVSQKPVHLANENEIINDGDNVLKSGIQSLMQRSRPSDSIHKKKRDQAKVTG